MAWPMEELNKVADIRGGATPRRDNPVFWDGDIPWVTPTDLSALGEGISELDSTTEAITNEGLASCSARLLPPGTVLFSSRATIGKVGIAAVPLATNQGFANFIPKSGVESRYLAWCLYQSADRIAGLAGSTTFREVSKSAFRRFRIPIPPLSEQRRIVDILDQADRLRRLRSKADAKAARILPALFIKMFGDPATNPMGWEERKLGEIGQLDRGRSRHRPRNDPSLLGGSYPLVQTGDIANSGGRITRFTQTYSEFGLAQSKIWPAGTLCITIAANIANTGVLEFDACFPDSVVGFVPGVDTTTEYVQFLLAQLQKVLEGAATQVAQKNINLAILRKFAVPVPPINLQNHFSKGVCNLYSFRATQALAHQKLDRLFASATTQAFSGELTAS